MNKSITRAIEAVEAGRVVSASVYGSVGYNPIIRFQLLGGKYEMYPLDNVTTTELQRLSDALNSHAVGIG